MSLSLLVHVSDPHSRFSRASSPATIAIRTDGGEHSAEVVQLPTATRAAVPSKFGNRANGASMLQQPVPLPREVQEALDEAKPRRPRTVNHDEPTFVDVIDVHGEPIDEPAEALSKPLPTVASQQKSSPAYGFDVYTQTTLPPPPRKGALVSAVV